MTLLCGHNCIKKALPNFTSQLCDHKYQRMASCKNEQLLSTSGRSFTGTGAGSSVTGSCSSNLTRLLFFPQLLSSEPSGHEFVCLAVELLTTSPLIRHCFAKALARLLRLELTSVNGGNTTCGSAMGRSYIFHRMLAASAFGPQICVQIWLH